MTIRWGVLTMPDSRDLYCNSFVIQYAMGMNTTHPTVETRLKNLESCARRWRLAAIGALLVTTAVISAGAGHSFKNTDSPIDRGEVMGVGADAGNLYVVYRSGHVAFVDWDSPKTANGTSWKWARIDLDR